MTQSDARLEQVVAQESCLENLVRILSPEMEKVNNTLREKMQSTIALIPQLAGYIIRGGGKRLRPMLTLTCARMLGYSGGNRHVDLAACVELLHTATLLHDDVIDESDMRRGQEAAHVIWGNKPSVLVGDFLLTRSFELMVNDGCAEVLSLLSKTASRIVEGEILQIESSRQLGDDGSQYLEVIEAKTSTLFAAACEVSAAIVKGSSQQREALRVYGTNLGVSFQLIDDILDYVADSNSLGKKIGDDFFESKITLPVLLAYQCADQSEKEFWQRVMLNQDHKQEDFETAQNYMQKHDVLKKIQHKAMEYAQKAADELEIFPDNEYRNALKSLAFYCVERSS